MSKEILIYRKCPLCGENNFKVKYKRNYSLKELKEDLFSARRERKKKAYEHNSFLKCKNCNLIYASPIINPEVVEKLYQKSKYNYGAEEENLKKSYGNFLKTAGKYVKEKERILDIGAGNGFFLIEALNQGYKLGYGIEPSKHAVELADKKIKKNLINDILRENQFKPEFFDVVTIFQTIDHIEEPNKVLEICNKYLKKDGIIVIISHNVESFSAKVLGEMSPIFDIEHTQLFSRKTITKILNKNGFKVVDIENISNTYALGYWIKMSPLPKFLKNFAVKMLKPMNLENKQITIKPGNFGVIARKIN